MTLLGMKCLIFLIALLSVAYAANFSQNIVRRSAGNIKLRQASLQNYKNNKELWFDWVRDGINEETIALE